MFFFAIFILRDREIFSDSWIGHCTVYVTLDFQTVSAVCKEGIESLGTICMQFFNYIYFLIA